MAKGSPAHTAAPPPRAAAVERPDRADQGGFDNLVRSIRMQVGNRFSSARLRLEPPELGRIRVDVRVIGDEVRVDVQAESQAARDALAERADRLKAGLAEHGMRIERFEVVVNSPEAAASCTSPWAGQRHAADRQADERGAAKSVMGEWAITHDDLDFTGPVDLRGSLRAGLDVRA